MDLPKRKANRLKDYDYSQPGCYFITICTKEKRHILSSVGRNPEMDVGRADPGAPQVRLSQFGRIVEKYIRFIPAAYDTVTVDQYVIMPNHIHLLLRIHGGESGAPGSARPTPLIPRIVAALKRFSNQEAGLQLWQTSYHDHIIRNDADYLRVWNYISTNPAKWREDYYDTEAEG